MFRKPGTIDEVRGGFRKPGTIDEVQGRFRRLETIDDGEEKKAPFNPGYNVFPNIDNPKCEGI